jgi:hypothetical protein
MALMSSRVRTILPPAASWICAQQKSEIYLKAGYAKLHIAGQVEIAPGNVVAFKNSGSGVQGAIGYEQSFGKNFTAA